jgi:hypothetical protein
MTAPIRSMPEYELYRVILDYEALQDGFLDRIDDLNTTLEQIDAAGGLANGNTQKLLTKDGGKRGPDRLHSLKRTFGWESLGKMLKGTGMALVLVLDDERFAPIKEQLTARKRPRQQANASSMRPTWLFTKKKARELGKKRWSKLTPAQRKRLTRKAGRASGKSRRRKARQKAGALLGSADPARCANEKLASTVEGQMVQRQAKAEAQSCAPHTDAARGAALARSRPHIPPSLRRDAAQ